MNRTHLQSIRAERLARAELLKRAEGTITALLNREPISTRYAWETVTMLRKAQGAQGPTVQDLTNRLNQAL